MFRALCFAFAALALSACSSLPSRTYALEFPEAGREDTLSVINAARSDAGRSAMRIDEKAQKAARRHARNMAEAGKMAHVLPSGPGFAKRLEKDGINTAAAENIAYGQKDVAAVVEAWMNSKGHRRNLLNKTYEGVGVASAKGPNGRLYWAMVLVP